MSRFVVEADGGSRGNPGPAAYGAVVRDAETGAVLRELAEHIGTASNNVAEYRGLIAGLEAVRELDPDATVEARLDSKLVVEQMSGRWKIKHPDMRPLALRARDALPPSQVTYTWVPREQNKHADRLANEALDAAARGEAWSPADSTAELRGAGRGRGAADAAPAGAAGAAGRLGRRARHADHHGAAAARRDAAHGGEAVQRVRRAGPGAVRGGSCAGGRGGRAARGHAAASTSSSPRRCGAPGRRPTRSPPRSARTVREVDAFRECAFGEWEGLTFDEVRQGWPDELDAWLRRPEGRAARR